MALLVDAAAAAAAKATVTAAVVSGGQGVFGARAEHPRRRPFLRSFRTGAVGSRIGRPCRRRDSGSRRTEIAAAAAVAGKAFGLSEAEFTRWSMVDGVVAAVCVAINVAGGGGGGGVRGGEGGLRKDYRNALLILISCKLMADLRLEGVTYKI